MSVAKEIIDGLTEFSEVLKGGENVSSKLTVRRVKLNLKLTEYNPSLVREVRELLNVSQAVFAEFIGASPSTVQAWEQCGNPVARSSARLMDEIRRNPEYWRQRLLESAESDVPA